METKKIIFLFILFFLTFSSFLILKTTKKTFVLKEGPQKISQKAKTQKKENLELGSGNNLEKKSKEIPKIPKTEKEAQQQDKNSLQQNPFGLIEIPKEKALPPKEEDLINIKIERPCKISLEKTKWQKQKPIILKIYSEIAAKFIIESLNIEEKISQNSKLSISLPPQDRDLSFKALCGNLQDEKILTIR